MPKKSQNEQPPLQVSEENANHEIRRAYNSVINTACFFFGDRKPPHAVDPKEMINFYELAFRYHRKSMPIASERWARATKHLARALFHEAKIAYLASSIDELPFIQGASAQDFDLHVHGDTTKDLLDSLAEDLPPGLTEMPETMKRYLSRGRKHLASLDPKETAVEKNELLRAEHIKAAHEYGRVVECLALAYEAEGQQKRSA